MQLKSASILAILLVAAGVAAAERVSVRRYDRASDSSALSARAKRHALKLKAADRKKVGALLQLRTASKRAAMDMLKSGKTLSPTLVRQAQLFNKVDTETVCIYLTRRPTESFEKKLAALGVKRKNNVWIPPVGNHKYGFAMYSAPIDKIEMLVEMPEIMRLESAEHYLTAQMYEAAEHVGAAKVWRDSMQGKYRGVGITVGLIDTGYDVGNPDLPDPVAKWAYEYVMVITNGTTNIVLQLNENADVTDKVSGHGTYMAGCIVGSGKLSRGYNADVVGIATGAQVHVVKASTLVYDTNGTGVFNVFLGEQLVQALYDISSSNYVDLINMSVGAWDLYLDGSSPLEQAVDYVNIDKGIPVFCAAGNLAGAAKHVSVKLGEYARAQIAYKVTHTNREDWSVAFNVVWADEYGLSTIELYDSWFDWNEWVLPFADTFESESSRGVKQKWYSMDDGWTTWPDYTGYRTDTVYLTLTNRYKAKRFVHVYISEYRRMTFSAPKMTPFSYGDANYTVTCPGNADRAITVGSTVSRASFNNISNGTTTASASLDAVSSFSGHGPRVDLDPKGELDLTNLEGVGFDTRYKPDFCAPGELVFSLFDSNVRDNNIIPGLYTHASPANTSLWWQSLPEDAASQRKYFTNGVVNYFCPQEIKGSLQYYWWFVDDPTPSNMLWVGNGTSPASAIGAGCSAMMYQRWPGFQAEELRRYMRPNIGSSPKPHTPGAYNPDTGFGKLDMEPIFITANYVDESTYINFYAPTVNDNLISVTNNPIAATGDFYHIFRTEEFYVTNLLSGWSTNVTWISFTNRQWWADAIVLSNYAIQEIKAYFKAADGKTVQDSESIWVLHRHGLNPPTVAVTNPTSVGTVTIDTAVDTTVLGGTWSDDSDVTSIRWLNTTIQAGGDATFVTNGSGHGTWSAVVTLEKPGYNEFAITATDDDGDFSTINYNVVNGKDSREITISKLKYKVNLKTPAKDKFKFNGQIEKVDANYTFATDTEFKLFIVMTNGVSTNVVTLTPEKVLAKGKGALFLLPNKQGKIKAKRKEKVGSSYIDLKVRLKRWNDLDGLLEVPQVNLKKSQAISKEVRIKTTVSPYFSYRAVNTKYWGKTGKNIKGQQE